MANAGPTNIGNGGRRWTLDTSAVIALGCPSPQTAGQWQIQVIPTGSGGSWVPKQCTRGADRTGGNLATCVYYESDSETALAAGAATSALGVYYIPSDGVDTYLDFTADTGSMVIDVYPLRG